MSFVKRTTSLLPVAPELSVAFSNVRFSAKDSDGGLPQSPSSSSASSFFMTISDIRAYDRDSLTLLLKDPRADDAPCLRQFHCGEILNHLSSLSADSRHDILLPIPASASASFSAAVPTRVVKTLRLPILNEHLRVTLTLGEGATVGTGSEAFATKRLNNLRAHDIAVSGSRKVCCVLFTSKRRVCLFLTDVLDEEEEEEEEEEDNEGDEGEEEEGGGTGEEELEGEEEVGGEGAEAEVEMMGNRGGEDGDPESDKENDAVE